MLNLYKKYYLEESDILNILKDGIIVFDTSALLDIYYYSKESQNQIFNNALTELKGRLWIPAQCYFEFLKNKNVVIEKPRKSYESLLDENSRDYGYVAHIVSISEEFGKKDLTKLKGNINTLKESTKKKDKHPYLNQDIFTNLDKSVDDLEKNINDFIEKVKQFDVCIRNDINQKIQELINEPDSIQQLIESNFEVGQELSFEKMLKICIEGRNRFNENIPPGYEDDKKTGLQKYGDLFVWNEILNMAKKQKKDVILISNDVKPDWWDKEQNAPCYELLKEFNSYTTKRFWCCSMKKFLYLMNQQIKEENKISEQTIDEVEDISKQIFEDSLINEIDNLYRGVLQDWLDNEYILNDRHKIYSEWRVFGKCYLFDASDYQGDDSLVLMNIIDKTNYSNVFHAINNMIEIKKYYDKFGRDYKFRQVVVAKSHDTAEQILQQIQTNKKLTRIFDNRSIENDIVFLDDGNLIYLYSNHPMG